MGINEQLGQNTKLGDQMNFLKLPHRIRPRLPRNVRVYTDGAIRPDANASGLSALVFDSKGTLLHWQSWQTGGLTCNEAEYHAVVAALEALQNLGPREVAVYTDSQIVVQQMQGQANVYAPGLRLAVWRLKGLAAKFSRVSFHHIPRKHNRLADALANDAADGRISKGWANGH